MNKKLIIGAALAAALASPAFAQSYTPDYGTGNVINQPALEYNGGGADITGSVGDSYALSPRAATQRLRGVRAQAMSPNDSDVVYEGGQYIGRDPDPNVRFQLRRDWTHE
jgi:hypothetical protein